MVLGAFDMDEDIEDIKSKWAILLIDVGDLEDDSLELHTISSERYESFKRSLDQITARLSNLKKRIENIQTNHPDYAKTLELRNEINAMFTRLEMPAELLEKEKPNRTMLGRIGIKPKNKKNQEEKAPKKAASEAFAGTPTETSKARLDRVKGEIKAARLAEERKDFSDKTFDSDNPENRSDLIIANCVKVFNNALIPPLLAVDKEELTRKQNALDAMKAGQKMYSIEEGKPSEIAKSVANQVKDFAADVSKVLLELAEESSGAGLKAGALFLGWPLILPVKALNQVFTAAKYTACFADGVLGFFDKGLDQLLEIGLKPIEYENQNKKLGTLKVTPVNIARASVHLLVRGPIRLGIGICRMASIGARFLERNIDADRWMKSKPVMAGFSIGGVGVVVLVALTLASIPGLGIPLAVAGAALGLAVAGAALHGYFKAKKVGTELNSGKLSPEDAIRLAKHNHTHGEKPKVSKAVEQNPSAPAAAVPDLANQAKTVLDSHDRHNKKVHSNSEQLTVPTQPKPISPTQTESKPPMENATHASHAKPVHHIHHARHAFHAYAQNHTVNSHKTPVRHKHHGASRHKTKYSQMHHLDYHKRKSKAHTTSSLVKHIDHHKPSTDQQKKPNPKQTKTSC